MFRKSITLLLLLICNMVQAQVMPITQYDTVFHFGDSHGKEYKLQELEIVHPEGYGTNLRPTPTTTCAAGYFVLYFEPSSTLTSADVNAMCQIFSDMSCFINSPLNGACGITTSTNNTKVKILITDDEVVAAGTGVPILIFPGNPSFAPSLAENAIWKTITSGTDAFSGVASPLISYNNFFHGIVNVNTSFNWNYNTTINCPAAQPDYYTVFLHEVMHILGFASNFSASGTSLYGSANNYFSKYDTYLRNSSNIPLLANTVASCPNSGLLYIGSPSTNVNPGGCVTGCCPTPINCTNAVKYCGSYTVPVYNPNCWVTGSSISHFENGCYSGGSSPFTYGTYFKMQPTAAFGTTLRNITQEERGVLCDLGYSVKTVYASSALSATKNYSGAVCNPAPVWGNNDGLLGGNYQYVFGGAVTSIQISKAACLLNDAPNCSMTCIGMVYNYTNVTLATSGSSITVSLVPGPVTNCGPILIKYIPVNNLGVAGNVTYIYVYLPCGNCNVNPCNLIQNGGFELGVACSTIAPVTPTSPPTVVGGQASCWQMGCATPDFYDRFCTVPLAISPLGTGINPGFSDTHNGFPNNRCYGFQTGITGFTNTSGWIIETITNHLSTPLVPGGTYQLSLWVSLGNSWQFTPLNAVLTIASSNTILNCPWGGGGNGPYPNAPNTHVVTSFTIPSSYGDFKWHYISTTFTFTANTMDNELYFGIDPILTTLANPNQNAALNLTIDDVSLLPQGSQPIFTPPSTICSGQVLTNIGQYAIGTGTIAGPGIQQVGSTYNLNATTLLPGTYGYSFIQTNTVTNCTNTTWAQIAVVSSTPQIVSTLTNNCITSPQSITLTAITSTLLPHTYTWQPGASNSSVIVVTPTASTVYTLATTNSLGCQGFTTYPVVILQPISFTNTPQTLCPGDRVLYLENYLATGTPTGGVWTTSSPSLHVQTFSTGLNVLTALSTATPGTYTVSYSYQTSTVCSVSNFFTVNVAPSPTLGASAGLVSYCTNIAGFSTTITAGGNNAPGTTYAWTPGGATTQTIAVTPTVATVYIVTVNNGSCSAYNTVTVIPKNDCCGSFTSTTPFNFVNTATISTGTLSGLYAINQNITISGTVSLNGEFFIAPNVSITVPAGSILNTKGQLVVGTNTVDSKAHLLSCIQMWDGIVVNPYGQVEFEQGDLIEDAKVGIASNYSSNYSNVLSNYEIIARNAVFNRNNIAISIKNYAQNNSSFEITGCLFTCRTLTYTSQVNTVGVPNWPSVANLIPAVTITGLSSPYLVQNFPATTIKSSTLGYGLSGLFSYAGLVVENCGFTNGPTSSSPYASYLIVGDRSGAGNYNVFDNLYYGIYALNSNVASYCNVFQNTRSRIIPQINFALNGRGIMAYNDKSNTANYNSAITLVSPANPTGLPNYFFECHSGIQLAEIFMFDGRYAEYRSNQNSGNISVQNRGYFGVEISGNRFKDYRIENCKFLNVQCGVKLTVSNGNLNLFGYPPAGQFWDRFNITNNYFSAAASPTASLGTGFMRMAVEAHNAINSPVATHTQSALGLKIMFNTMDRVWNGILVNNFATTKLRVFSAENRILLAPLSGGGVALPFQNGVQHLASNSSVINSNTITAFTTDTTYKINGVYSSMNTRTSVQCNSVVTIPRGFNFYSLNATTWWLFNRMYFNGIGLQLTYTATIGQQGGPNNPSDNIWEGNWTGRNGTWTYSSTSTSSKIYQRGSGNYYPPNNDGNPFTGAFQLNVSLFNTGGTPANYSCSGNLPSGGGGSPIASREIIDVAADTIPPQTDPDEIEQFLVYMNLKVDSLLLASNDTLQGFVDAYEQENLGILSEIERLSAEGDYSSAAQLLANFVPETNIQSTYKSFYDLYISVKQNNDSITEFQLAQLQTLALQCPFADGEAVYKARAFYAFASNESPVYNDDNCTSYGFSRSSLPDTNSKLISHLAVEETKKIERSANKLYRIYPNPTSEYIFISSSTGFSNSAFLIRDISGRILKTMQIPNGISRFKISLDLDNGIYFVTVSDSIGNLNTKRIVVHK